MKRTTFGLLVLVIGMLSLWGCSSTTANVLFGDEFSSLNTDVWLSFPSLTPFASLEGSNIPGEVKVEEGILKLSRFAPELSGENQVSLIQAKNTVDLPDTVTVTMRFRNEFIAFGLSNFVLEIYDQKIAVGHSGLNGVIDSTYSYHANEGSFFILSLDVTRDGYTIKIKGDNPNSTEEIFSQNVDLSRSFGNSTIMIWGGSNIKSAQYSEIDYFLISE